MKTTLPVLTLLCLTVKVIANPLVVAHRGASKDAPENTIPAFELAWQQQADAIEGDFHLTMDGEIVCIHDKNTAGVARTKKVIRHSTLEELRKLDVGEWFGDSWKGTRIPTISEVFETIPAGKKIYIEVKCGPEILPKLHEELKASGLSREQVVVISFNSKVIRDMKTSAPSIKAIWLSSFKKGRGGHLKPSVDSALKIIDTVGADGLSSYGHDELSKEYVDGILSRGLEYHVWTIDDIGKANRFLDMGVHSITTNRPGYIRKGITEPGT